MSPFPQLLADQLELRSHSRLRGASVQQELSSLRPPADVREAEKVENLRPSLSPFTTSFLGKCTEAEMPCFVGVQLEPESLKAFAQVGAKPSHVDLMLEPQREVI